MQEQLRNKRQAGKRQKEPTACGGTLNEIGMASFYSLEKLVLL